jgi:hypothetical protein
MVAATTVRCPICSSNWRQVGAPPSAAVAVVDAGRAIFGGEVVAPAEVDRYERAHLDMSEECMVLTLYHAAPATAAELADCGGVVEADFCTSRQQVLERAVEILADLERRGFVEVVP